MIIIAKKALDLEDMQNLLFSGKKVGLDDAAMQKVEDNFKFLRNFSANKLIYGINTGFGPMAQYKVKEEHINALQYNLIRSHSSGAGNLLAPILVKSLMIARLNTLMLAYSGVHPELPHLLKELINKEIIPCIPEHGGVGASGDLVQLAHLALVLIGEGEVHYEGEILATSEVFYKLNIRPISIHLREGLAVMNGTSAMTGISLVNLITANRILKWAVILSAMSNEVVSAFDDHFSHELNSVKKHIGQNRIAEMLRTILSDSKMIRKRSEHFYNPANIDKDILEDKVQEYYSLRCVSQVLGPVLDTITNAENILVDELNSVNDNPVIDHVNQNVYHGGNFHGDYVSLEMDKLKIAITKLSMLSERQLNYLLNDKLNNKFPPFVNLGVPGLNFGMQGMQFTATSTVAENQTLSFPMYVHSIPNNNDNQDIVSMGCNAALMTRKVLDNTFEILAIQLITLVQAIDFLSCDSELSTKTRQIYLSVRAIFPKFSDDKPKYKALQNLKHFLEQSNEVL